MHMYAQLTENANGGSYKSSGGLVVIQSVRIVVSRTTRLRTTTYTPYDICLCLPEIDRTTKI